MEMFDLSIPISATSSGPPARPTALGQCPPLARPITMSTAPEGEFHSVCPVHRLGEGGSCQKWDRQVHDIKSADCEAVTVLGYMTA